MATALPDRATLAVTEVAQILRIHRDVACDAVHRGDIPSIGVGRVIRVPTAKLANLLGLPLEPERSRDGRGYEAGRSGTVLA